MQISVPSSGTLGTPAVPPEARALHAFANPAETVMTSGHKVLVASAPLPSPRQAKVDVLRQPVPASVNTLKMHLSVIGSTLALI